MDKYSAVSTLQDLNPGPSVFLCMRHLDVCANKAAILHLAYDVIIIYTRI